MLNLLASLPALILTWKDLKLAKVGKIVLNQGEKQNADVQSADTFVKVTLPQLLEKYAPQDIYNAVETGLYWRGMPDRGYFAKGNNKN